MGSSDNRGEEGEAAGEEEGEVSANIANITTTTTTNAIDSNAAAVTTTIPPVETGQENATTTATEQSFKAHR